MKKFEIVKTTAEISWKERNEIKEGCTMYDVDPEKIASFGTKEEAEKELKKYKTDVCASGSLFTVEEFSIQENEYDEDGELAKSVYKFLEKGLLRECIKDLLRKVNLPEEKVMICFVMVTRETLTRASISDEYERFCLYALQTGDGQDLQWRDYYLKKLDPNGICSITGKADFIPPTYPKAIRNPRDSAKLFVGGAPQKQKEKLNSMPVINPGYVITQKIIHTLQCMNYEGAQWAYQVVRENKGITKEVINKIENDREMTEEEKKKFEKKNSKKF